MNLLIFRPIVTMFLALLASPVTRGLGIGLGGANLTILCQPQSVRKGDPVNIGLTYSLDVPRLADIHFDLLGAIDKAWLAGTTASLDKNNGSLSINLTVPADLNDTANVIWKVFVTPRNETFPNMLAEVGLNIPITDRIIGQCPFIAPASNGVIHDNVDFILIEPRHFNYSRAFNLTVTYALHSRDWAEVNANLMDARTDDWIFGLPVTVVPKTPGKNKNVTLHIPAAPWMQFIHEHVKLYIDVSLTPIASDWSHRLAKDRIYL